MTTNKTNNIFHVVRIFVEKLLFCVFYLGPDECLQRPEEAVRAGAAGVVRRREERNTFGKFEKQNEKTLKKCWQYFWEFVYQF